MVGSVLKKYIEEYNIRGGSLCMYIPTRWTFMFKTTNAIVRLKKLLEKIWWFLFYYLIIKIVLIILNL